MPTGQSNGGNSSIEILPRCVQGCPVDKTHYHRDRQRLMGAPTSSQGSLSCRWHIFYFGYQPPSISIYCHGNFLFLMILQVGWTRLCGSASRIVNWIHQYLAGYKTSMIDSHALLFQWGCWILGRQAYISFHVTLPYMGVHPGLLKRSHEAGCKANWLSNSLQATAERERELGSPTDKPPYWSSYNTKWSALNHVHTDDKMGSTGCIYIFYTHVYKYVTITIKEQGGFQPGTGVEVLKPSNYYEDRDQVITSLRPA